MFSIYTTARCAFAVLAIAAIPAGAAFAEGNGPTYEGMVTAAPSTSDVGQGFRPNPDYTVTCHDRRHAAADQRGQGEPQPINSLPPGFEDGTPAMLHRQAMQRYWAARALQTQHLADANQQPNG